MDPRFSPGRWRNAAAALAAACVVCGTLFTASAAAPALAAPVGAAARAPSAVSAASETPSGLCGAEARGGAPSDVLRVVGSHLEDSAGQVIMPDGISVVQGDYAEAEVLAQSEAQIDAAVDSWHANAIRLQVSEDALFEHPTPRYGYNVAYARAVTHLVCAIIRLHRLVILNDDDQLDGGAPDPTSRTVQFWKLMSEQYGSRFPVVFDLFNEPRLRYRPGTKSLLDTDTVWRLWQDGGTFDGTRYVGMQALSDDVRRDGADNVIEEEGPYETSRMQLLPQHLITGANLLYGFHKEDLNSSAVWSQQIGAIAARGIPLEDGEWSLFASPSRPWECYSSAFRSVPRYLAYLHRLSVPLMAWGLKWSALVKAPGRGPVHETSAYPIPTDPAQLTDPTVIEPSFGCDDASLGQGAGALVKAYFKRYSTAMPAALFPTFAGTAPVQ